MAPARTRRALSANSLFFAMIFFLSLSEISLIWPFARILVQRESSTSGAPFVNWIYPPSGSVWTVDIIFRSESKGASATLLYGPSSRKFLFISIEHAQLTRAASVGSPSAFISSLRCASEHSAIASASFVVSLPYESTTVILFCVSVPVLSEQMTSVHPSVSTAVSLRMIALRLLIFVTPIESTIVTTAASPSGMAATARETAIMNVSRTPARWISP